MKLHEDALPSRFSNGELVAWDLELFGMEQGRLHRPGGTLACISVAAGNDVWQVYGERDITAALKQIDKCQWVLQKGEFDFRQARARGILIPLRRYWDTHYIEKELFNNYYSYFGLDSLSRRWLQRPLDKEARELFFDSNRMTPAMKRYAARDAWTTLRVAEAQMEYVRREDLEDMIERAWYEVDLPALWTILDMRGILVDVEAWRAIAAEQQIILEEKRAGFDFNPGSTKQVQERLVAEGVKLTKKTKKGKPCVDADFLATVVDKSPTARAILGWRSAAKFASTYGLNFLSNVEADGRIYSSFNVIGTETFRLSSDTPNLQNIPKRDPVWGPRYRRAFVPAPGNVFVKTDYKQCQVAVFAEVTGDEPLRRVFETDGDVHTANAAWLYGVKLGEVTKEQRRHAKGVTFGVMFLEGPRTLAENENIPLADAKKFINLFYSTHPGADSWTKAQLRLEDTVIGPGGHRMWVNPYGGKHADNNKVNSPIQEGEVAIHKRAAALLHQRWPAAWGPFGLVLLVHDELVVEVPKRYGKACARLVERCALEAEATVLPHVRPAADVIVCQNWYGDE